MTIRLSRAAIKNLAGLVLMAVFAAMCWYYQVAETHPAMPDDMEAKIRTSIDRLRSGPGVEATLRHFGEDPADLMVPTDGRNIAQK